MTEWRKWGACLDLGGRLIRAKGHRWSSGSRGKKGNSNSLCSNIRGKLIAGFRFKTGPYNIFQHANQVLYLLFSCYHKKL